MGEKKEKKEKEKKEKEEKKKEKEEKKEKEKKEKEKKKKDKEKDNKKGSKKDTEKETGGSKLAFSYGAVDLSAVSLSATPPSTPTSSRTDPNCSPKAKSVSGSPFTPSRSTPLPPSSLSSVGDEEAGEEAGDTQSSAQPSSSTNASPPPSPSMDSGHTSSSNAHMSMYFIEEERQREMEEIEKEVLKMELKKKMSPNMYQSVIKFESDVAQLRKQVEAVRKREKLAFLRAEKEKKEERERQLKERELQEAMKGGEDEGVKGKIHMFKKIAEGGAGGGGGGGVRLVDGEPSLVDEKEGEEGEDVKGEEGEEEKEDKEEEEEEKKEEEVVEEKEEVVVEEKKEEKKELSEEEKLGRMRANVIKEFVDTERDYIVDIHTLLKVFVYPMQVTNMITSAELRTIFSNIEDVVPIHESFLEKLETQISEQIENGGQIYEVELGGLLSRFFHYFKLYSIYASNQDASLELLEQLKKKKDIANFLEVCHTDPACKNQFLNSYLIKPIQRLCKYPLLLRELMKNTPEEHPDHKALQDSTDKVNSVVNFVNEAKRKEEKAKRMRAIADKFGIKDLVREGRVLIKEGKLGAWKKGGAKEDRYLFVFNDLVLVMKPVKRGDDKAINERLLFKKIASADLSKTRIINHSDRPEDGMVSAFEIMFDDKALMFCCASASDKKGWVKSVNESIKEFQKQAIARMKREKEMEDQHKERSRGGSDADVTSSPASGKKKGKTPLKRAMSIGGNSNLTPRRK